MNFFFTIPFELLFFGFLIIALILYILINKLFIYPYRYYFQGKRQYCAYNFSYPDKYHWGWYDSDYRAKKGLDYNYVECTYPKKHKGVVKGNRKIALISARPHFVELFRQENKLSQEQFERKYIQIYSCDSAFGQEFSGHEILQDATYSIDDLEKVVERVKSRTLKP